MENTTEIIETVAPAAGGWTTTGMLLYIAAVFALIYLLFVLPNKRRMKEYKEMIAKLKVGARVMTSGGIYGTVKKIEENKIAVEIAKGVVIEVTKNAIANVE